MAFSVLMPIGEKATDFFIRLFKNFGGFCRPMARRITPSAVIHLFAKKSGEVNQLGVIRKRLWKIVYPTGEKDEQ